MSHGNKLVRPLVGQRVLQLIPADSGWNAWFIAKDGSQVPAFKKAVAAWVVVEAEQVDDSGSKLVRKQDVVAFICGGARGLVDATLEDDFIGVSTSSEIDGQVHDLIAAYKADEDAEES